MSKAALLARQPIPYTPPPVPQASDGSAPLPPPALPSIANAVNSTGNVSTDEGTLTIIKSVPDFRYPITSWIYSLQSAVTASAYNANPFASPASVLGYIVIMFTGLMYFNDANVAPAPSSAALEIMNDYAFSLFFNALLDLPVPNFADLEFSANMAHYSDTARMLGIIPDLSCSTFLHDFGRLIPASMFTRLHNLMAHLPANTTPSALQRLFYSSVITNVTFDNGTTFVDATPSMYLGLNAAAPANNMALYTNWFQQRIERIITALAIRPVFTAPTIGPIPIQTVSFANNNSYNAYIYMSSASRDNLDPLLQFVRSLGSFIQNTFPNSKPLRAYTQVGSNDAASHLIFQSALQTWTSGNAMSDTEAHFTNLGNRSTHTAFGNAISAFAARPDPATNPTADNHFFNTHVLENADPVPAQPFAVQMSEPAATPANQADPIPWLRDYSPTDAARSRLPSRSTPSCLIFALPGTPSSAYVKTIISGKIIEINDISVIGLTLARPESNLHSINSMHIQGAIPISRTHTALNVGVNHHIEDVPPIDHLRLSQTFFRGTWQYVRIPLLRQGIIQGRANALTNAFHEVFGNSGIARYARQTFTAFNVFSNQLGHQVSEENPLVNVWSSYRFYDKTQNTNQIYILPSLRHIYGTQVTHAHSQHPSLRIP